MRVTSDEERFRTRASETLRGVFRGQRALKRVTFETRDGATRDETRQRCAHSDVRRQNCNEQKNRIEKICSSGGDASRIFGRLNRHESNRSGFDDLVAGELILHLLRTRQRRREHRPSKNGRRIENIECSSRPQVSRFDWFGQFCRRRSRVSERLQMRRRRYNLPVFQCWAVDVLLVDCFAISMDSTNASFVPEAVSRRLENLLVVLR